LNFETLGRHAAQKLANEDARLLLRHASGKSHSELIICAKDIVPAKTRHCFEQLLARRQSGDPVAYIVGEKEFWSLAFKVNQHVLIPRPETESVVETALKLIKDIKIPRILDVGTGSGAILISLLTEQQDAVGTGVDISDKALDVARANSERHHVQERGAFHISNYLEDVKGRYDLVVSNPPYIDDKAMAELPKDVKNFEPEIALSGGQDGLSAYRTIIAGLSGVLKPGGHIVFEVGFDQKTAVSELLMRAGFADIACAKDLAGHDRILSAKLSA